MPSTYKTGELETQGLCARILNTHTMSILFYIPPIPKVKRILKPRKKVTPFNNRRYKLHQKVKGLCDLRVKERTIIIGNSIPIIDKYIIELQTKFQYNIQSEIFDANDIEVKEPETVTN